MPEYKGNKSQSSMGPWVVWKKNKVFAILPAMSSNPFMSENKQEIGTRQGQSPHLQPPQPNTPGTLHMTVTKSLSAEGPSREEPREFFKGLKLMSLNTFAFREFSYCLQKQSLSCNFNSLFFFSPPSFSFQQHMDSFQQYLFNYQKEGDSVF